MQAPVVNASVMCCSLINHFLSNCSLHSDLWTVFPLSQKNGTFGTFLDASR